ncbi:MAG: cytochrome c oxidase subunit II [Anaerolineae bacterium]|nr:cytochrome c oxidase subunit II [Anaerolineae bacterium]
MKRNIHLHWLGLALVAATLWLALALPAQVGAHGPADGGASRSDINDLFSVIFWISVPIFLLVEGLILFAIVRYRRRHRHEMPDQVEGNHTLEVTWTVLSFVIIGVVFALTTRFMMTRYEAEANNGSTTPDLTVHVTGYMFNWDYEYFLGAGEETGIKTTRKLTVPANRNVLLEITSTDVQHSFWLPSLAGKIDAVPGYTNTMWLNIKEPGQYTGNCAEYCGTLHYDMLIEVEALEPATFDTWLAGRMTSTEQFVSIGTDLDTPLPQGDAARGAQVFSELGCAGCHGAAPGAGPALAQIASDATSHTGASAEAFLRESILLPCAEQASGYNCQIMPSNYGEKLDAQGLADIIAYLLAN